MEENLDQCSHDKGEYHTAVFCSRATDVCAQKRTHVTLISDNSNESIFYSQKKKTMQYYFTFD